MVAPCLLLEQALAEVELEPLGSKDLHANVVKQAERAVASELEEREAHRAEVEEHTATLAAAARQRPRDL